MPSTTLRLYRGDDAATAETISRDTGSRTGAAVAERPEAAPRVLPFPSARTNPADETARVDRGGVTLRFHASHDGGDGTAEEQADGFGAGVFDAAGSLPDVLPLSAILSHPDSGLAGGYRIKTDRAAGVPDGAIAGRVGGWVETPRMAGASDSLTRAKALHANRTCKSCGAGGVEPVLLADTVRDAAGEVVPGSGTLVGFHCGRCEAEWPVA